MPEPMLFYPPSDDSSGAIFSEDRRHRYRLWRRWDSTKPLLMTIGLNPSVANEDKSDHTITRLKRFARDMDYGGLLMGNLFAYVSTYPKELYRQDDPVGPDTDSHLTLMAHEAVTSGGIVIAAWGNHGKHLERDKAVCKILSDVEIELQCFGKNKDGSPTHPLFIPASNRPMAFTH